MMTESSLTTEVTISSLFLRHLHHQSCIKKQHIRMNERENIISFYFTSIIVMLNRTHLHILVSIVDSHENVRHDCWLLEIEFN